jgi:lysophospholipase L1-like esterase/quercetin dioxygenase-like cupin family protein
MNVPARWIVSIVCLFGIAVAGAGPAPRQRIFIAGDSTASFYPPARYPRMGWGQVIDQYFDTSVEIHNHAQSGRSARSFIEQGWLDGLARELHRGDLLLIQFGHNDESVEKPERYSDPRSPFPGALKKYLALARKVGATPILITPVARRQFRGDEPVDTHGVYASAVRDLAAHEQVALIDLTTLSMNWLRALGPEASRQFYLYVPEQNLTDDTHFHERGALAIACLVAGDLRRIDAGLAEHLRRDADCSIPESTLRDRAGQKNPSLVESESDLARDQPGPHGGAGKTSGYPFFANASDLTFAMRKRVLHPGAGIGLHAHHSDEAYYVISGHGVYILDGKTYPVAAGNALLTRAGSSHALQQSGDEDLVILITYPVVPAEH